MTFHSVTIAQRIERNIKRDANGCWIWTAQIDRYGYGQTSVKRKKTRAHRATYELYRGAIPAGLQIDHLCRVRACCNPDHLEAVTCKENIRRSSRIKPHCPQGHPYSGDNLILSKEGYRSCRVCARMFSRTYMAQQRASLRASGLSSRKKPLNARTAKGRAMLPQIEEMFSRLPHGEDVL